MGADVSAADFPDGMALGWETVEAMVHTGTHVDAPWHYGPELDGEAVVLDFSWMDAGEEIPANKVDAELEALEHDLPSGEIVLIETGADDHWGTADYLTEIPGMGAGATEYLLNRGIRVIGAGYSRGRPFAGTTERSVDAGHPPARTVPRLVRDRGRGL
jgi:kynurenine formamidase